MTASRAFPASANLEQGSVQDRAPRPEPPATAVPADWALLAGWTVPLILDAKDPPLAESPRRSATDQEPSRGLGRRAQALLEPGSRLQVVAVTPQRPGADPGRPQGLRAVTVPRGLGPGQAQRTPPVEQRPGEHWPMDQAAARWTQQRSILGAKAQPRGSTGAAGRQQPQVARPGPSDSPSPAVPEPAPEPPVGPSRRPEPGKSMVGAARPQSLPA